MHRPLNARSIAATALGLSLALVSPGATAFAQPLPDRGDHGAQARCLYRQTAYTGWAGAMRLLRLRVLPPTLFAQAGATSVGWRLNVQRASDDQGWRRIFTSKLERASATPTQAGALQPLEAYIGSPLQIKNAQGDYISVSYRAVLRFYWFDESGNLVGTERSLAGDYGVFRDGSYLWTDIGECNHGWLFQ